MMDDKQGMAAQDGGGWLERVVLHEHEGAAGGGGLRPRLPYAFETGYAPAAAAPEEDIPELNDMIPGVAPVKPAARNFAAAAPAVPHDRAEDAVLDSRPVTAHAYALGSNRQAVRSASLPGDGRMPAPTAAPDAGQAPITVTQSAIASQNEPMPAPEVGMPLQATLPLERREPPAPRFTPAFGTFALHQHTLRQQVQAATVAARTATTWAAQARSVDGHESFSMRAAPLSPREEPAPEPVVEIHIGRVDVRAQTRPAPAAKAVAPASAHDPLAEYLAYRSRGARS
jgi:hypothetical protein